MLLILSEFSTFASAFKLILLLVLFFVLLLGAHLVAKWYAKSGYTNQKTSNIKIIESQQIAPGKNIVIAKIGGKYVSFVLFKESAEFLTELDEEELMIPETKQMQTISFADALKKVKRDKERDNDSRSKE